MPGIIAPPEGFDYYPDSINAAGIGIASTWTKSNAIMTLVAGRFGGKAVSLTQDLSGSCFIRRVWPASDRVAIGYAYRLPDISQMADGNGYKIFALTSPTSDAEVQLTLSLNLTGQIQAWLGEVGVGAKIGTATRLVYANTWQFIEIGYKMDDAVGVMTLDIDGERQFTYNGDTKPGAATQVGRTHLCTPQQGGHVAWDDLYYKYDDFTILGEARVQLFEMNGDFDTQFDPLTGVDNFAMINDASTDGDTSYNSSNTVGAHDFFNMASMTNNPDTIHSVSMVTAARKEDAGTRTIRNVLKLGGTVAVGADFNLTTDYLWLRDSLMLDPNAAEWLKANFNTAHPGYEVVL